MAASLEQETGRISVGAGTNLAGSLVARVLGLAATILLTRLLGAAGYGLWTLARSVASVGEITGCLGLGDGVARFTALAEGTDEPRRLARVLAPVIPVSAALVVL